MRSSKATLAVLLCAALLLSLAACGAGASELETTEQGTETTEQGTEAPPQQPETAESTAAGETKILVAYFSATGNTKAIAEKIAQLTGGDLFEIVAAIPYTEDDLNYGNDACRANQEQNDASARPEISGTVENMGEYDFVLLGHPIWWGEEPRILDTFVESYDLSGKTVVNFCTSGGSGISAATDNLKALTPGATWLEGHRFQTDADPQTIQAWLDSLNILN